MPNRASKGRMLALLCAIAFVFFVARLIFQQTLDGPATDVDEIYFDTMAINVAAGHGFSGEISPEVLAVYGPADSAAIHSMDWAVRLGVDRVNTFRPPLYPALLAACYRILGHSMALSRILNCALLAAGAAMILLIIRNYSSGRMLLLPALLMALDPHLSVLSRTGISESLAFLLVCGFFWIVSERIRPDSKTAGIIGFIFGLMILTRPVFLFWLPVGMIAAAGRNSIDKDKSHRVLRALIVLIVAAAVETPWAIRNCRILGEFKPLGSQGDIAIGTIYYDPPAGWNGNWSIDSAQKFEYAAQSHRAGVNPERETAEFGRAATKLWMSRHIAELPRLGLSRIYSLWWKDAMPYQRMLIVCFLISSLIVFSKIRWIHALLLCSIFHSLAIAASYNAEVESEFYGRILLSLYPLFFLVIGLAAASINRPQPS